MSPSALACYPFFLFRFALVDCIEIWQTIESILGSLHPFMQSQVCIIALLTCCSLITALLTYQICIGKIHVLLLYFITALYLLLIFAIIMLKSRGISGFNVNPLLIVQELLQAPLTVLFNMLAFMPIGLMLAWKCQSPKVTILLFLAFITICELIQSILHLGIFDVDDILLNTFWLRPWLSCAKPCRFPRMEHAETRELRHHQQTMTPLNSTICPTPRTIHRIAQSQPAHGSIIQLNPTSTMRNSTFTAE